LLLTLPTFALISDRAPMSSYVPFNRILIVHSSDDPATISENDRILRDVRQVMAATGDRTTARSILLYYRQRCKCEESARLGKTALGMEKFCLRKDEAFPRLMLVLVLAIGILSWIELKQPELIQWLCMKHPGRHKIKFGYYRLIEWLKRQIHPPAVRFLTA